VRALTRALTLALALGLAGCTVAPQRYSSPQVQTFSLDQGDLERDGLAVLTPSTVTGQEEDKQPVALVFSTALGQKRPAVRLAGLAETLSAVNRAGLTDAYKRMYQDYRDTGLFDPALLQQVGEAVGVRYAAQIKVAGFRQVTKDRFGVFGLNVLYTQTANIRVFLQIWDTRTGAIAWEGVDELSASYETASEKMVTLQSVALDVAGVLIERLP
jgi:hypothetical protein